MSLPHQENSPKQPLIFGLFLSFSSRVLAELENFRKRSFEMIAISGPIDTMPVSSRSGTSVKNTFPSKKYLYRRYKFPKKPRLYYHLNIRSCMGPSNGQGIEKQAVFVVNAEKEICLACCQIFMKSYPLKIPPLKNK